MEDLAPLISSRPSPSLALPEALSPPTNAVSNWFMTRLALATTVLYICYSAIGGLLLPLQINTIDPAHKIASLGIVTSIGAFLALIGNPLAGALSDRTILRFGRRRPWILLGALASAIALVILMTASSVLQLVIGWSVFQFTSNCTLAPLAALVPDQVPERQRGTVAAFVGLALPVGSILGSIIIGQVLKTPQISYLFLILVLLIVLLPYALFVPDKALPREYRSRFHLGNFLKGFWVSPRAFPDFGWAWLTRFLAILAYALGTGYTFYYLQDDVKLPAEDVLSSASILSILVALLVIIFTIISGILSDRFQRRKIFVLLSSLIIAASLLLFALFPTWTAVLLAAVVLGAGFGMYIAVDGALVTQVLPSAISRGKDLGVINIANTLPQSLAPAVAAFVVSVAHSYLLLFLLAAVCSLLSGFLIRPIQGVR